MIWKRTILQYLSLISTLNQIGTTERSDEDVALDVASFHPLHHPQRDQVSRYNIKQNVPPFTFPSLFPPFLSLLCFALVSGFVSNHETKLMSANIAGHLFKKNNRSNWTTWCRLCVRRRLTSSVASFPTRPSRPVKRQNWSIQRPRRGSRWLINLLN
jgi:hypothetical protein